MEKQRIIDIKGMHCASCSSRIERVVGAMDGVICASVNLAAETLKLDYDESLTDIEQVKTTVDSLGFELITQQRETEGVAELDIKGMHCASCSSRIERVVSQLSGVQEASVNLAASTGRFVYDANITSVREIKNAISSIGFEPSVSSRSSSGYEKKDRENIENLAAQKQRLIAQIFLVIPLLIVSMGEMIGITLPRIISPSHFPANFSLLQLFLTIPIMILGRHFYLVGIPALLRKSPNMDSLIAVGTGAAFIYSFWNLCEILLGISPHAKAMDLYFESVGVLIALVSLGKYLESRSKYQTSDAIRKLMQLTPKTAILLIGDKQQVIGVDEIEVGDVLLVKPGSHIPTDGEIIKGESYIDESLMTGEPIPVFKTKGDFAYGGTVNTNNAVQIAAAKTGENTVLANIIRMVQEAQGSKAPIARVADKISYYFVPAVMVFAILTGFSWYFLGGVTFSESLRFFIAVMVIACPCAMGLATPISVMVGTGRGAQLGILVKNGETLEKMEKIETIIFDKTGTITKGEPEVTDIVPMSGFTKDGLLSLAAAVEQQSEHPLAEAIVNYAERNQIVFAQPDSFTAIQGRGIVAELKGKRIVIGNIDICKEHISSSSEVDELSKIDAREYAKSGKTVLYVVVDEKLAGQIVIEDAMKMEVPDVMHSLKEWGIEVIMLTGDNKQTAEAVARKSGISKVIAEVLPDSKAQVIKDYQQSGKMLAMVGDGINDAPALAQADVGIAMGTGIDIAIESGDVVIMKGDLQGIITALRLSRAVMKNIRQNLFWAFGYNILGIPVAAGLLYAFGGPALNPMIAGAAMALSSVSVVTNALRLQFFDK